MYVYVYVSMWACMCLCASVYEYVCRVILGGMHMLVEGVYVEWCCVV